MSPVPASLVRARVVSAVIALVALVGVALLSLPTTTTRRTVAPLALDQPTPITSPSPTPTATPVAAATLTPSAPAPVVVTISVPASSAPPSASASPSSPAPSATTSGSDGGDGAVTASCPLGLAVPAHTGGLQSLISLSPAFGPFSAEAFAMAPAYAPLLTLLGPILAKYPELEPKISGMVQPFVRLFATLTNLGFTALNPLYAPFRTQVLTQEAKLATAFEPYVKQLADSPVAGCAIGIESLLTGGA